MTTHEPLNRRDVLRAATAGTVGLLAGECLEMQSNAGAVQADGGWIDAHSHIWTRDVKNFPLAKGKSAADLAPPSFTAEELLALTRQEKVDRVVLIAHHPYYGFDNSYLIDAAARFPNSFRIVGAIDAEERHLDVRMRELLKERVTGFRITPLVSGEKWLESPGMDLMWRTGTVTNQAMCCLINPEHLTQIAQMCKRHRETPVVIDHFARIGMAGEPRREDVDNLCSLAQFDRVYVKISAYYALGRKKPPYHDMVPLIKRLHGEFGAQRLMWASDSPYQLQGEHTYRASLSLVRDHLNFITEPERDWLLRGTAEKVFFYA